jgi:hypothetical protein
MKQYLLSIVPPAAAPAWAVKATPLPVEVRRFQGDVEG